MTNSSNPKKPFPLEQRTLAFADTVRAFVQKLPRTVSVIEDGSQVIRSSGSVGANYIESREALSRRDCANRLKICRKEAKESAYWMRLLSSNLDPSLKKEGQALAREAHELTLIFNAIVEKHFRTPTAKKRLA